jgi:hypothetical protein
MMKTLVGAKTLAYLAKKISIKLRKEEKNIVLGKEVWVLP